LKVLINIRVGQNSICFNNLNEVFENECNVEIGERDEYSHSVMKILDLSNVITYIQSFSKLHGVKSFGFKV
jgi:hypothetical protein